MANAQPDAAADGEELLDTYLDGVSPSEDTPPVRRKVAQSGDPEDQPTEDEPETEPEEGEEEGAEEDGDTDAEDDAADEDDDQSQNEAGRFVGQNGRVRLPDGSVMTVGDLIQGNLRMADYTRKTQETGALHQELQARQADYAQQEQIVSLAIDIMAAALPPEPDPSLLDAGEGYDPIAFTGQKLRFEEASKQLQALQMAKQQMNDRNQQIQGTLMRRYALEQKDRLLAYKPELTDRTKLEAFNGRILKTLAHYNMGAADLAQVYSADIIRALDDLGHYRAIMTGRQKARQKGQGKPVLAPGPRQSPQGKKARTQSRDWETLRKTGGRDAAGTAALDRILDDLV